MRKASKPGDNAFTAIEMMVTILLFSTLLFLLLPHFARARETAQLRAIGANLKTVETAKDQWALDHNRTIGDVPSPQDIAPYILGGAMPEKVVGESYTINPVGSHPSAQIPIKLGPYSPNSSISLP